MRRAWLLLIGLGLTILLDLLWLGLLARGFYQAQLGGLLGATKWLPAILVWLFIVLGIILFVLPKAKRPSQAASWGAAFGFILYGVYELTNYALLAGWPRLVVVVDILWGASLCGAVATALFLLKRRKK